MSTKRDWSTTVLIFVIIAILAALCWSARASAQDRPRTADERELIALVARVSFNEALDSYEDLALIWQVVEGHGETHRQRAAWLRRHSSCVSGVLSQDVAYQRPGNCRWSRNLMPDGRRPRGWDRARDGRWDRIRDRWLAHIRRVRAFVLGTDTFRPCTVTPDSWDGGRWRDRIEARGHRVEVCGEARNVGVLWPG